MKTEKKVFHHAEIGDMYYLLQMPEHYEAGKTPFVVFLHGVGERGHNYDLISVHGLPKMVLGGRKIPAVVISPQCPVEYVWHNIPTALKALIDEVISGLDGEGAPVSITGISMGGYGTWEMTMTYPDFFYKAAPICGGGTPWRAHLIHCPVWAFHGDQDSAVPPKNSYEMVDAVNQTGGNARLTLFHGVGHLCWEEAYEDSRVIDWLTE